MGINKRNTCGTYGHKQKKCPKKNQSEEEKGNKKLMGKCNHCGKVEQKATNCWKHETNKDKRPKNWKKKEKKEVGALKIEVLLGSTKASTIKYENSEVLFKNDLWELVLQR